MRLNEFFYFQKSDRIVIAVLAVAIAIIAIATMLTAGSGDGFFASSGADSMLNADKERASAGRKIRSEEYYYVGETKAELFPFDPNTADSTTLLRLGLKPWMVRNVYKYRAAGGIFSKPGDFAQIYGLTLKQYKALEPYIRIGADYLPAADFYTAETKDFGRKNNSSHLPDAPRDTLMFPYKLKPGETIALNTADTTQLKKVPGIGSGYAAAIVNLRERLGGFYSAEQLLDIEGLPETALPYFSVHPSDIKRINLNRSTYGRLRRHPYLNFYQARDIIDYRRIHGDLKSLSDLRLLKSFTDEDFARLSHYVEF